MPHSNKPDITDNNVLSVIMGGGQGTRLFPLTKERAKPAVPLAGKYRLVDIPISNCINSGLRRIYLLTQFNTASLHRHISQSYKFDHFSKGFVEVLAAQQTFEDQTWYQGTADAVRKNLVHFLNHDFEYLLILSGDQLYRMDLRRLVREHADCGAEVTVASMVVDRAAASSLGILHVNEERRITRFVEKPKDKALQDSVVLPPEWHGPLGIEGGGEKFLASMGIYVFNRDTIIKLLDNDLADFGKHIIPNAIETNKVYAYVYQGYWEDIGTIHAFFEANLDACADLPKFNYFDMASPVFSRPRYLPGSKINGAQIDHAMVCDGCIINPGHIKHCIIGIRSQIGAGSDMTRVVMMGCDYYESAQSIAEHERAGLPRMGIGTNCRIENTIIDKNARIGNNCVITPAGKPENLDHDLYYIRDGIVIVPKNGIIPHGTVI
ncbi:MAG TPA: glucose-1-phosphate adenylyltransferase [Verrucomicrobiae bacterium]|nr:glucose-1-phosphate adenylyltransferase [Verrucomicrobiae bacterium]